MREHKENGKTSVCTAQNMILAANAMEIGSVWCGAWSQMDRIKVQSQLDMEVMYHYEANDLQFQDSSRQNHNHHHINPVL